MLYTQLLLLLPLFFFSAVSNNITTQSIIQCNSTDVVEFKHNFCESRLQNDKGPEMYNAYTSLFITTVPLVMGFPENEAFANVAYALFFNGFASFYYHYYLSWVGKQADEISMIFANYFGIVGLLNIRYKNKQYLKMFHFANLFYMYAFLIGNTVIKFDVLFPYFFAGYLLPSLYLIRKIGDKYKEEYVRYLALSSLGGISWIISELFCNKYTVYGHVVWHFFFPLGFYFILMKYDKIYTRVHKARLANSVSELSM
jgi:hypothetical protein|uniref:Uncharacterized protein n=1 Tax=Nucleocytoviricota sp. TaxID=2809609 RepID=A0A9E8G4S6_9VIRU|nr:hypothetical protein [Nucleocytoviricota sp.]